MTMPEIPGVGPAAMVEWPSHSICSDAAGTAASSLMSRPICADHASSGICSKVTGRRWRPRHRRSRCMFGLRDPVTDADLAYDHGHLLAHEIVERSFRVGPAGSILAHAASLLGAEGRSRPIPHRRSERHGPRRPA